MINYHDVPVDPDQIQELRDKFLDHYGANSQDFDERDIEERIKVNDWYVKRFLLLEPKSMDKALAQMIDVFKWRKAMRINDLALDKGDIPVESVKNLAFFFFKPDKNGNMMFYHRGEAYKRWPDEGRTDEIGYLFLLETLDRECAKRRCMAGYVYDARNVGIANLDFSLFSTRAAMVDKWPYLIGYAFIAGFPPIINGLLKV